MKRKRNHALILLAITFFTWGVLSSANSILVAQFQSLFNLSYKQSMFVQIIFYFVPFLVCIPTSIVINRCGYKLTLAMSLMATAVGASLLFLSVFFVSFIGSLVAVFCIALGVSAMQVVANPYVIKLGEAQSAPKRLTLNSSINALGTTLAPLFIGLTLATLGIANLYLCFAVAIFVIAIVLLRSHAQDFRDEVQSNFRVAIKALLRQKGFMIGAFTLFIYVGVEVSVGTVSISYLTDENIVGLSPSVAMSLISLYWAGSMLGRFLFGVFGRHFNPARALACSAFCAALLIIFAMLNHNVYGGIALILLGLCNSFMYPVIFSRSIEGLGPLASSASALLVMCGVGAAILPFIQAAVVDFSGLIASYLVPLAGYIIIFMYSAYFYKRVEKIVYREPVTG